MNINIDVGGAFVAGLTILFIALKLTGHIAWSWWWVLSPLWIGFAVAAVIFVTVILISIAVGALR